jgi:hypothetical protein
MGLCAACYQRPYNKTARQRDPTYLKRWHAAHPGKQREYDLKRYLSVEAYDKMLSSQDGRCAICGKEDAGRTLVPDHDHATDIVRGLLCAACNFGIGWFRDDPARLAQARKYLANHVDRRITALEVIHQPGAVHP